MSKLQGKSNDLEGLVSLAGEEFHKVWQRIGITGDAITKRKETVMNYTCNLFQEMLDEELALEQKLKTNVKDFSSQIESLCIELGVSVTEEDEKMSLLMHEKTLNGRLVELQAAKKERENMLKSLLQKDKLLSAELTLPSFQIKKNATPSTQQLQLFQQHILDLETEKNKRQSHLAETRARILRLLEALEVSANTSFERDLVYHSDTVGLSIDNMHASEQYLAELEKLQEANKEEMAVLWGKVRVLWTRLGTAEEERVEVEQLHQGCSQRVILSLSDELCRLEELRAQNMRSFVAQVREELQALWQECFVPPHIRATFTPLHCEEMSEELLEQYEQEVRRMQKYQHENHDMLSLVARQQSLWNQHVQLEQRANQTGTERYSNRGGKLLEEEKTRKRIKMQLPKVEEEVFRLIEEWEERNGRVFLIGDMSFKDFVRKQKDEWANEKENEKMIKQEQKARQVQEELMYGSKPATPSKRFANTPTKTPCSKSRKLDTPSSSRLHFRKPLPSPVPSKFKERTDSRTSSRSEFTKAPLERSGSLQVLTPKNENRRNMAGNGKGTLGGGGGSAKKLNFGSSVELRGSFKSKNPSSSSINDNNRNQYGSNNNINKISDNTVVLGSQNPDTTITLHPVGLYKEFANDINKASKSKARSTLAPTFL